jgi:phosphatidylglycerophosphatase A
MLLAAFMGGWEWILILVVMLLLLGAKGWARWFKGLRDGLDELRKAAREVNCAMGRTEEQDPGKPTFSIRLFVAQGLGIGLIPFAPGTFGSLVGLVWFAMLVATGSFWAYLAGAIEGIAFSIWLCDDAEKILGETDPGSVVLDEIIAIPFCFLPWVAMAGRQHGALPDPSYFFAGRALWMTLGLFALFRLFDIWKPWPVRQAQRLPGGWGVTIDDLLAAAYVALISLPLLRWL